MQTLWQEETERMYNARPCPLENQSFRPCFHCFLSRSPTRFSPSRLLSARENYTSDDIFLAPFAPLGVFQALEACFAIFPNLGSHFLGLFQALEPGFPPAFLPLPSRPARTEPRPPFPGVRHLAALRVGRAVPGEPLSSAFFLFVGFVAFPLQPPLPRLRASAGAFLTPLCSLCALCGQSFRHFPKKFYLSRCIFCLNKRNHSSIFAAILHNRFSNLYGNPSVPMTPSSSLPEARE